MWELPDIIHQLLDVIRIKNGIGTYGLEPHFRSCNICGELAWWQNTSFLCLFLFVSNHPSTEQSEKLKSLSGREKKIREKHKYHIKHRKHQTRFPQTPHSPPQYFINNKDGPTNLFIKCQSSWQLYNRQTTSLFISQISNLSFGG